MKSPIGALFLLLIATVCISAPQSTGVLSKDDALAMLRKSFSVSEVVVLARDSQSGNNHTFVCSEVWKRKKNAPGVGERIEIPGFGEHSRAVSNEAIIFLRSFPATPGAFQVLWLSNGALGICPDLKLDDIKEILLSD
jgi:hypothetical protein